MVSARLLTFLAISLALGAVAFANSAEDARVDPWALFAETGTIEIATVDEDGNARETSIWIVVDRGAGYVRTNDSAWLANVRRGSTVEVRIDDTRLAVRAEESEDGDEYERVEEAFKSKYGWVQRMMSRFRTTRPTVLRLTIAPQRVEH